VSFYLLQRWESILQFWLPLWGNFCWAGNRENLQQILQKLSRVKLPWRCFPYGYAYSWITWLPPGSHVSMINKWIIFSCRAVYVILFAAMDDHKCESCCLMIFFRVSWCWWVLDRNSIQFLLIESYICLFLLDVLEVAKSLHPSAFFSFSLISCLY
jgi:hypothetical protein